MHDEGFREGRVTTMKELTIDGIDIKKGMTFSGAGGHANYIVILETFLVEVKEKLEMLTKCIEEKNLSLYTVYVHALKSACASIGATEVSKLAEALEIMSRNGESDVVLCSHEDFVEKVTTLLDNIQEALKDKPVSQKIDNFNNNEIIEKLESLRVALEDYNIILVDQLSDDLQLYTSHPTLGSSISEILHKAFITDYDEAMQQIDEIL